MSRMSNGDIVKILQPGMNTHFMKAAAEAPQTWRRIADFVPSTEGTETYPWLGGLPDPTEWTDERKRRKFKEYSWTIENKEYELTVAIRRATLDDEKYGQLNGMATKLGRKFPSWMTKQIFQLLAASGTTVGYDGQYLVDVDHSEGNSGVQSNKGTSALTSGTYATARAAMMGFKDDQGAPIGKMGTLLVVPAGLEVTALEIVKSSRNSSGVDNVLSGTAEVLVNPFTTDTNDWFLIDVSEGEKPFILQERIALEVGFDKLWSRSEVEYGGYWRGAFGLADWRSIYGAIV
jgi:phage major head subunit gpT-like protein